jgi:hypothetical protein
MMMGLWLFWVLTSITSHHIAQTFLFYITRIVTTMPTLRIVYLTEQQYAGMTDHDHAGAANNTAAEEQIPSINQEHTTCSRLPIADVTRNAAPSNKQSNHEEEDNDYLDTSLQEAIDGVNIRIFGGHAVWHQQVPQEEEMVVLSSDEGGENYSSSSERVRVVAAVQQFQHEIVSSDEENENDSTPSPAQVDAVQQKSGNKRKRPAPIQSFDDRFNDLMAFKAKYGHCDASRSGENSTLVVGRWCIELRVSYKKIQNNQKPKIKLSDEQIQRLNDAGFK